MNIFSQPVTWIIAAILGVYLVVLLRSLFTFFFGGGREQLLEQEANLLEQRGTGDNSTPAALVKDAAEAKKDKDARGKRSLRLLA